MGRFNGTGVAPGNAACSQVGTEAPGMMTTMTPQDGTLLGKDPLDHKDASGASGGSGPVFTMREAAKAAGVSTSTLRRKKTALIAAGAVISDTGWKVPMTALIAAELIPGEGEGPTRADPPPQHELGHETVTLRKQIAELEHQVSELRHRAEVAEAIAAERQQTLDVLRVANDSERMALRMLTGGSRTPAMQDTPAAPASSDPQPGLLRRIFGGK